MAFRGESSNRQTRLVFRNYRQRVIKSAPGGPKVTSSYVKKTLNDRRA